MNQKNEKWKIQHIGIVLFILCQIIFIRLLYQNANAIGFTDEGDSITGGWLVSQGWLMYRDIFAHHMPWGHYATALLRLVFNPQTPQAFRQAFAILTVLWISLCYFVFYRLSKNRIPLGYFTVSFLLVEFVYIALIPRFWGFMILADSYLGFSLIMLVGYLVFSPDLDFSLFDEIIISFCVFTAIMSAATGVFPIIVLIAYYCIRRWQEARSIIQEQGDLSDFWKSQVRFACIVSVPFIVYFLYLLISNTFGDFWEQAIKFNTEYYANYTQATVKDLLSSALLSWKDLFAILPKGLLGQLGFSAWVESVILLLNISTVFWLRKKNVLHGVSLGIFIAFSRIRTGFHMAPYYMVSAFSWIILLVCIVEWVIQKRHEGKTKITRNNWQIAFPFAISLLMVGLAFGEFQQQREQGFWDTWATNESDPYPRTYGAYFDTYTTKEDTIWVAPFSADIYFTENRLPATYALFYLPWQGDSQTINDRIISDLEKNKPSIIIFAAETDIWGYALKDYGQKVYEYIVKNYSRLADQGIEYDVFIRRDIP